ASMRMVAVLPAPSGPTKPKIAPRSAAKVTSSTALTVPKRLQSPWTDIAGSVAAMSRPRELDTAVFRHAGHQFVRQIVDIDFDAVDERYPFGMGLNRFGRELRAFGYEGNPAVIHFAGKRISTHRDLGAEPDAADVGFVDVGAQPNVIEIGERDHRRARLGDFAEFGLAHENNAIERRL